MYTYKGHKGYPAGSHGQVGPPMGFSGIESGRDPTRGDRRSRRKRIESFRSLRDSGGFADLADIKRVIPSRVSHSLFDQTMDCAIVADGVRQTEPMNAYLSLVTS